MDTFIEQIVAVKKSAKERMTQIGIILLGILLIILCGFGYISYVLGGFSFLFAGLAFGIGYAMWYFFIQLN